MHVNPRIINTFVNRSFQRCQFRLLLHITPADGIQGAPCRAEPATTLPPWIHIQLHKPCAMTKHTHTHTSVDTNPTLQSKAMQTHLRCAWLRLPALEWCDRILARHSWSSALTWGRWFLTRYMYILEWWKLFLTGCLDVLSSYNDKPEQHYFVGNRQVLMKRLNFLLESFRWKPFFSRNWGVRREVQFSSQGSVKPKRGFCLGQWVIFYSSNHSEKQEKSVSTVHSWPLRQNAEIDANYPVRVCFKLSFYNETKTRLDFNVPFWNDINSSIPSAAVILYC